MTGPERQTLADGLARIYEMLGGITARLDAAGADMGEMKQDIKDLSERVQKIETKDAEHAASAAAIASVVAADKTAKGQKQASITRVIGIAASVATILGVVIGIAIQVLLK